MEESSLKAGGEYVAITVMLGMLFARQDFYKVEGLADIGRALSEDTRNKLGLTKEQEEIFSAATEKLMQSVSNTASAIQAGFAKASE